MLPQGHLPLLAGLVEGLCHPKEGVEWGWGMGVDQGYPGIGYQHPPGCPCPVVQATHQDPLSSGDNQ